MIILKGDFDDTMMNASYNETTRMQTGVIVSNMPVASVRLQKPMLDGIGM